MTGLSICQSNDELIAFGAGRLDDEAMLRVR